MLSLVLIVIIVANIVLWNYQMNQLDWERMQERIEITADIVSSWFPAQNEYTMNKGSYVSGNYTDTQTINDQSETFKEGSTSTHGQPQYRIDINGTFNIDFITYPPSAVQTVEIQLRYHASDIDETWYLKAYNWTLGDYSDSGFNSTTGNTPTTEWNTYGLNLTDCWQSYTSPSGTILIKLIDGQPDQKQTTVNIDFLAVRTLVKGTIFTVHNTGSQTAHLVSLWITNSTTHQRYDLDTYINAGDAVQVVRSDITLPSTTYVVKIVTEKGNAAVYSGH